MPPLLDNGQGQRAWSAVFVSGLLAALALGLVDKHPPDGTRTGSLVDRGNAEASVASRAMRETNDHARLAAAVSVEKRRHTAARETGPAERLFRGGAALAGPWGSSMIAC